MIVLFLHFSSVCWISILQVSEVFERLDPKVQIVSLRRLTGLRGSAASQESAAATNQFSPSSVQSVGNNWNIVFIFLELTFQMHYICV